jgi:carboxypeptidase-like protein/TonB-dependent receptor-like protein
MKRFSLKPISEIESLTRILSFISILLFSSTLLYGQGIVTGLITDNNGGDPLIAATVVVKGTTTGTVTDYNGKYTLALKAGAYTLEVSYIGYTTVEETVTMEDNQTVELNVSLPVAAIMGEEAVVTMQARGQLAAVNQQLRSNNIVNVVSAERIKELPDQNAAKAVSRLPGVHLDGAKIVIRGIQPKMNKILINGVEMPATEGNNRASSIGNISANVLSGIEVYKTLTPDMDADAIGGVVNLILGEAKEGLHGSVMGQGTYSQHENLLGSFKMWGDVSNRYFDNKLGLKMSVNYSNG